VRRPSHLPALVEADQRPPQHQVGLGPDQLVQAARVAQEPARGEAWVSQRAGVDRIDQLAHLGGRGLPRTGGGRVSIRRIGICA
jgi:hypothetical protein